MSLINCKECGHEVSDKASVCPNCGAKIKSSLQIGCLGVILVIIFAFFLIGTLANIPNDTKDSYKITTPSAPEIKRPQISDFVLSDISGEWDSYYYNVKGKIKNNGSFPAGVEVELIIRDNKNIIIKSTKFYPNSTSNIPQGDTMAFSYPGISEDDVEGKFSYTLQIIDIVEWK